MHTQVPTSQNSYSRRQSAESRGVTHARQVRRQPAECQLTVEFGNAAAASQIPSFDRQLSARKPRLATSCPSVAEDSCRKSKRHQVARRAGFQHSCRRSSKANPGRPRPAAPKHDRMPRRTGPHHSLNQSSGFLSGCNTLHPSSVWGKIRGGCRVAFRFRASRLACKSLVCGTSHARIGRLSLA